MAKLFGTDGVRGIANKELTCELAYKLGRAGAYYLTKEIETGDGKPLMLMGKDTRISGDMLEAALTAGITSTGVDVIKLGIITTPGVAYLTRTENCQGGIMISASHNPIADNGIKFFDSKGYKLVDRMEDDIEDLIFNNYASIPSPTHEKIGIVRDNEEIINHYIDHLLTTVKVDFSGLKIVLDCANGAAYFIAPEVFRRLGSELLVINDSPNGEKINVNSGSTNPQVIKKKVLETGADLGIAHDGDADRLIMVDERGNIIDGDKIMAILALYLMGEDRLQNNVLVTTRYSNLGLKELLEEKGARMVVTRNGDRYVLQEMLKNNYNLGGEKSGHIIFLDYNTTGDGVLTALQIVQVIKETGQPLSHLAGKLKPWPQKLANIRVKFKNRLNDNEEIKACIREAEGDLGDNGRVFVRASGTEPVIRVMLESKDESKLRYWLERLVAIISRELN